MSFITETLEEKTSVLIVAKKDFDFVHNLKLHLKTNHANVYLSPTLPINLDRFDYCFLINFSTLPKKTLISRAKKIAFIFINNPGLAFAASKLYANTQVKIINLTGNLISKEQIDKILWFSFSKTKESFLTLRIREKIKPDNKKSLSLPKFRLPNKKRLVMIFLFLLIFAHLLFIAPLAISSYLLYQAVASFKQEKFPQAKQSLEFANPTLRIAKGMYYLPRSTFLFFSFAFLPDDIFDLNERASTVLSKLLIMQENAQQAVNLLLKKDKTSDEKRILILRIERIREDLNVVENNLKTIEQKTPYFKSDLTNSTDLIAALKKILFRRDSLLANNTTNKYLLLFANNMELRPGGGFIGSFGIMTIKDYTLTDIKIYDVYDADGQLVAHIEPPGPIRIFLDQPHWFLRDSAFSADFLQNYVQAKFFLEKEMGFKDFSGSFLLTTSAIQNFLDAFGEIYLPDFNEKVNQKNFYLKAQLYAEKDFFPGSLQKKNFLASLTKSLLLNLDNVSFKKLAKGLKKSLDEKQLVLYFDDAKLQQIVESLYWSGRAIEPVCPAKIENCINNYVFPIEANLGVNKANFFVSRSYDLRILVDKEGKIDHVLSIQFNNDSPESFPGGTYKNYFQLYLPNNAKIKNITRDGTLIESYDEKTDQYNKIGVFFEIKAKTISELKIHYDLAGQMVSGNNVYQLIIQKQIGAANSDLTIRIKMPNDINIVKQNFPALVKDGQVVYNTSLTTDKIFFMELTKE